MTTEQAPPDPQDPLRRAIYGAIADEVEKACGEREPVILPAQLREWPFHQVMASFAAAAAKAVALRRPSVLHRHRDMAIRRRLPACPKCEELLDATDEVARLQSQGWRVGSSTPLPEGGKALGVDR